MAETVARDFGLARDWLNGGIGAQLAHGLPPRLIEDLEWLDFGKLHVGLAGRQALIALKLFAAADQGLESKHVSDLIALAPTDEEWAVASVWVAAQDLAPEFPGIVGEVVQHVRSRPSRHP